MPVQQSDGAVYTLGLRVLGSDFRLEFTREESRDLAASAWSRCVAGDLADDARVVTLPDGDEALSAGRLSAVTSTIVRDAWSRLEGSRLVLKAFGLAAADGRVLLVAGHAGPGVFDQVLDLARSDFGYVSDEILAIGDDLSVLPCPRPLTIPDEDGRTHLTTSHSPDDLGLARCPDATRLARFVVLEPDPDSDSAALEPMTLLDTLTALAPLEDSYPSPERPIQRLAAIIERSGGGLRLVYPEGADIRACLLKALDSVGDAPEFWGPITGRPVNAMAWGLRDGRVRQMPYEDAVETDEGALVLAGGTPFRLGPLGCTLWRAALDGATHEQLETVAVAEHGEHPDAAVLVRHAVAELLGLGTIACAVPMTVETFVSGVATTLASRSRPVWGSGRSGGVA